MKRPEFESMAEGVRVSSFMERAVVGRWRLEPFTITRDYVMRSKAQAIFESHGDREELEMRLARTVPTGSYISLQRLATPDERRDLENDGVRDGFAPNDPDRQYVPVMSDTPSEIAEHMHAFENAVGNVLITGLGLGVLVSGLLANLDVDHITVVEIDRDVIALAGPYYADHPRVTIVNADALAYARDLSADGRLHFDYAWHDIWSTISERNLDDDNLAEHGISYRTMFRAFEGLAVEQGAWAHEIAVQQRVMVDRQVQREFAWVRAMLRADTETRVLLLAERIIREHLGGALDAEEPIPAGVWEMFDSPQMPGGLSVTAYARQIVEGGHLREDKLKEVLAMGARDSTPMGRPNEAPEANVA